MPVIKKIGTIGKDDFYCTGRHKIFKIPIQGVCNSTYPGLSIQTNKMDSGLLAELNKLKNAQEYLEKSNKVSNHFTKYDCDLDLNEFYSTLENERKNETQQLANHVKEIWLLLNAEKTLLKEGNVELLDIRYFKKRMIDLQEKLYNLKIKVVADYETLKEQEASLSEVLETFNNKISEWEKNISVSRLNNHKTYNKSLKFDSDYKEVKEFMDFVNKSNGHENGWTIEDHQLFLKFRNKYKSVDDLSVNLHRLLPDITPTAVREHEAWFTKYLFLKRKKDEALDKWRKVKKANVSENKNDEEVCVNKIKHKIFQKCVDEDVQKKIAQWKAEKEIKRQQEKIIEETRKEKMKRLEIDKKRLHYQIKETVTKWKEEKLVNEFNEKIQKEVIEEQQRKIRAFEANKLIKQFQSQDDIYIGRMRSSKLKKPQISIRSKSSYSVPKDPKRILQPTKQWLLRTSKNNFLEGNFCAYVPNIKQVPKLGIPEWRRNT
ncbi:coiled-coil domain-containing protein 112-like [Tribolium madens]|uniref:coiled-coil domain-containing protein 112-like n=1 Tax=Tribolium madens TaxID=41895 RepID=UPI001CF75DFA|nr:coiled-coil domain-containing protein 112-like [Tribolium madens]